MTKKVVKAEKAEVLKETPVKKMSPSNNKEEPQAEMEQAPGPQPQAPEQPVPESFTITKQGVDDLVQALNEVIASKYVKQVLFNVINENFKPVFAK
jgi:hypothetical protein